MIENLRYHIDGEKLRVSWNIVTKNKNVSMRFRLRKKLNEDIIFEAKKINLELWRKFGYGYETDAPHVPVYIEVIDDDDGSSLTCDVVESPKYNITYATSSTAHDLRETKEFERMASLRFDFPSEALMTNDEIAKLPPWMISGLYTPHEGGTPKRFFWQGRFRRNNVFPDFLYKTDSRKKDTIDPDEKFAFEIVPEIKTEKFSNLFSISRKGEEPEIYRSAEHVLHQIDLNSLAQKDDGRFYRIRCPFCFEKFSFRDPVFRAPVAETEEFGFPAEEDTKYNDFCRDKRITTGMDDKLGKVLEWNDPHIRSYALASAPTDFIPYDSHRGSAQFKDVVVSVRFSASENDDDRRTGNLFTSTDKICPCCHNALPSLSGLLPIVMISMMGNTGSGKSVYLHRLAEQMDKQNFLPGYDLAFEPNKNKASQNMNGRDGLLDGNIQDNAPVLDQGTYNDDTLNQYAPSSEGDTSFYDGYDAYQGMQSDGSVFASFGGDDSSAGTAPEWEPEIGDELDIDFDDMDSPKEDKGKEHTEPAILFESDDNYSEYSDFSSEGSGENYRAERKLGEATSRNYHEPFVYQLVNRDRDKGLIIALFDFPGECILRTDNSTDWYDLYFEQLLKQIDGMIFLFDPMTLDRVRNLGERQQKEFAQSTYLMDNNRNTAKNLFELPRDILRRFKQKYYPVAKNVDYPIAYVVSKADALRDKLPEISKGKICPQDMSFLDESSEAYSKQRTGIDQTEIDANSEDLLRFMDDDSLRKDAEQLAIDSRWICVSATGIIPNGTNLDGRYGCPLHCMEPLEWLLWYISQHPKKNNA